MVSDTGPFPGKIKSLPELRFIIVSATCLSLLFAAYTIWSSGQRIVRSLDSHPDLTPLDAEFLLAFRQGLQPSQRRSVFVDAPKDETVSSNCWSRTSRLTSENISKQARVSLDFASQQTELVFPVNLFSNFPLVPSIDLFNSLLDTFSSKFIPSAPFLRSLVALPTTIYQSKTKPPYFTLAMAAVASTLAEDAQSRACGTPLFRAAVFVHTASAEVDNRMTRRLDWVAAVSIILRIRCCHH